MTRLIPFVAFGFEDLKLRDLKNNCKYQLFDINKARTTTLVILQISNGILPQIISNHILIIKLKFIHKFHPCQKKKSFHRLFNSFKPINWNPVSKRSKILEIWNYKQQKLKAYLNLKKEKEKEKRTHLKGRPLLFRTNCSAIDLLRP